MSNIMRNAFHNALSKVFTVLFIFLFATSPVLAQTNWTPPTGPATGNNVPPPLNVGGGDNTGVAGDQSYAQHKEGDLYLESDLILDGTTDPNSVFSSWITSFFGKDVLIGSPLAGGGNQGPFPLLFLNGTFRYAPKAVGTGSIAPLTPEELADGGYENVLIGDAQGNVRWTDAANVGGAGGGGITVEVDPRLPFGTVANQVLVWNGAAWVPGTMSGGATLPDGTNQNDILVWDTNTQTWIVAPYPSGGGMLPAGTQGQTMWYNGTGWQATNRISYTQDLFPPNSHLLHIGDLNTAGDVVVEDANVSVRGNNVGINTGTNYQEALTTIDGSGLVVDTDNTAINSANTIIGNSALNPLSGRFLYSTDDMGKVSWNKTLKYERVPFFGNTYFDSVQIMNDPDDTNDPNYLGVAFSNEGPTSLHGNTWIDGETKIFNNLYVTDAGDLYLEGLEYPADPSILEHLCVDPDTGKVSFCEPSDPALLSKESMFTCTPDGCDLPGVSLPYTFQFDDVVDITYCGAGGGGGGGGRGADLHTDQIPGYSDAPINGGTGSGGGGGGGGGAGQCHTFENVAVTAGTTLSAVIGSGGEGGADSFFKRRYETNSNLPPGMPNNDSTYFLEPAATFGEEFADEGGFGGDTEITLSSGGQYPQATGGAPGFAGTNGSAGAVNQPGEGGDGGNLLLPSTWHAGSSGVTGTNPLGGNGGDGESPAAGTASSVTGSAGGAGGNSDTASGIARSGADGKLSYGGGGGSGGYGDYQEQYGCGAGAWISVNDSIYEVLTQGIAQQLLQILGNGFFNIQGEPDEDLYDSVCRILRGGNGGAGGDGYVRVEKVNMLQEVPTELVYATPGTYTFDWTYVPSDVTTVTIKVWGGGGGGGRAHYNNSPGNAFAGGGGAGGYVEHTLANPGTGSATIVVGAGGNAGAQNAANAGGNGGQSKFGSSLVANGGLGGAGDLPGGSTGTGGAGGTASGGSVSNENGPAGSAGSNGAGGAGGNQATAPMNVADGGTGGMYQQLGADTIPTAGKSGRVEITW